MKLKAKGIHIPEPLSWPHRDHPQKFPTSLSRVGENPVQTGASDTHPQAGGRGVWLTGDES